MSVCVSVVLSDDVAVCGCVVMCVGVLCCVLLKIQDSSLSEFVVMQVSCASQCWKIKPLSQLQPSGNCCCTKIKPLNSINKSSAVNSLTIFYHIIHNSRSLPYWYSDIDGGD